MEPESVDTGESFSAIAPNNQRPRVRPDETQCTLESQDINTIKELPKELGVMLITAGIVGFILPGPGAPAIIAGGLVLWPEAFGKLESWLERAHPKVHREGMKHINRFLSDLQKRYPNSTSL